MRVLFISILLLKFTLNISAAEAPLPAGQLPAALKAALATLPPEAAPVDTRIGNTGTVYALLPNGCEIIIKEKRNAPVAAVQAWVRTGAIHEGRWMGAGLSHFCEHMLFKGTTKRPTGILDQEIRGSGGDDNAYTSQDRTVYHITTESKGFSTAFAALADMLMDSTFPPDETVKEQAVVVKEIERSLDSPDGALWETFERTIFSTHPYGVPVLGYTDRFKRVTREEVFAYYKARYTPQLCTFLVVGDVDAAKVIPEMAKTLSSWIRTSIEPVAIAEEPPQVAPRTVNITHPACEVPKFVIAYPSVAMRHPDVYALDLLSTIAGDGRTSRLYRELKDTQQLALDVAAFDNTPLYAGYFAVTAQAEENKIEEAKKVALAVLESFKTTPPTAEELTRAKRKIRAQHIKGQMTAEGLAERIGSDWLVCGDLDFSERYTENMQKVTADDIVRVAKQYFVPEKLTTVTIRAATPAPDGKDKPAIVELDSEKANVAEKEKLRAPLLAQLEELKKNGSVADPKLDAERAIFSFTLKPSGVRVVVRDDASLPVLNVTLASLGGMRWEPADKNGAANLLANMLERGTVQRDAQRIAIDGENIGANLDSFSGRTSFGVQIEGLSDDAETLVKLASECMLTPKFDAAELEKLRLDTLQQIEQEDESLFSLNAKVLRPLLYGNHPYSRSLLGTKESIATISVDDLKKLHAAWVQPENLCVSLVGKLHAADAAKLLAPLVGNLPTGKFTPPSVPPPAALNGTPNGAMAREGITGAVLTIGYPGAGIKDADRDTLDVIAALLSGMGGRLNTELREKQGLAYAVGAHTDSQIDTGSLVMFVQTDPQGLEKSFAGMQGEAAKLRDGLVPEKELQSVKNYLTGTEAIALQNQGGLCQRLALAVLYGEDIQSIFDRRLRVDKITPAQIQAAAVKYLASNRWAKAEVKPK